MGEGELRRLRGRRRVPRRQRASHPACARRRQQHQPRDRQAPPGPRPQGAQEVRPEDRRGDGALPILGQAWKGEREGLRRIHEAPRRPPGGRVRRPRRVLMGGGHTRQGRRSEEPLPQPRRLPERPQGDGHQRPRLREEGRRLGLLPGGDAVQAGERLQARGVLHEARGDEVGRQPEQAEAGPGHIEKRQGDSVGRHRGEGPQGAQPTCGSHEHGLPGRLQEPCRH